jgi:hypothetical protein
MVWVAPGSWAAVTSLLDGLRRSRIAGCCNRLERVCDVVSVHDVPARFPELLYIKSCTAYAASTPTTELVICLILLLVPPSFSTLSEKEKLQYGRVDIWPIHPLAFLWIRKSFSVQYGHGDITSQPSFLLLSLNTVHCQCELGVSFLYHKRKRYIMEIKCLAHIVSFRLYE